MNLVTNFEYAIDITTVAEVADKYICPSFIAQYTHVV